MKYNTKQTLKIYWQATWRYKWLGILAMAGITIASISQVIVPLYFKKFFDILTGAVDPSVIGGKLIAVLVMVAVFEFLGWLGWRSAGFAQNNYSAQVMADLSDLCFAKLHLHSFSYFTNNFVGTLVKRVQWFVKAYENVNDRVVYDLTTLFINIVFITAVLFSRSLILGLIVVVWIIVFLAVNYSFSKYKYKYDVARNEAQSDATGYLADTVTNNANLKLFNAYQRELDGFIKKQEKVRKLMTFSWNLNEVTIAVQAIFMVGLEIGLFYLAIGLWQKGLATVGDFVLIQAYLINIFNRIWNFGRTIIKIYEGLSEAEEMTVILTMPQEIQDIAEAKDLKVIQGEIEFKDVGFNYHQTRKVLDKFNLRIIPGEKIGLVGPSGAGKTTIAKLILRQYDLTSGKILIDGQNIAKVRQSSLWQNVSLVPQDPILFHRSLKENIRYGNFKATDKEVVQAAKFAHCHEFIKETAEGYETYVGERGIKLSGGERQRVAIARAILHNAPILVLDEATSSLDSESEMLIQKALDRLMTDKTVIAIAHRLSTIKKMDRIIVVDEGGIVEQGTHEELIVKKSGLYKKLWALQAGGFIQ